MVSTRLTVLSGSFIIFTDPEESIEDAKKATTTRKKLYILKREGTGVYQGDHGSDIQ
jgi:hypothetical protein